MGWSISLLPKDKTLYTLSGIRGRTLGNTEEGASLIVSIQLSSAESPLSRNKCVQKLLRKSETF